MMEQLKKELEQFISASEGKDKLTGSFPVSSLENIARDGQAPKELEPLLFSLLSLASRYDDYVDGRGRNNYEGEDLHRQSFVYAAMASLPASEKILSSVLSTLKSNYFKEYFAHPGSPDVDKYDRDVAIERAQDEISYACVSALARHGKLQPKEALQQLKELGTHRNRRTNLHAQDILRMLEYYAA